MLPGDSLCLDSSESLNNILTETDTKTFFPIPNFSKPKPRLFSETKFFRNRNRDFFSETKFSETETETLKDLAKVSKPKCQSLRNICIKI